MLPIVRNQALNPAYQADHRTAGLGRNLRECKVIRTADKLSTNPGHAMIEKSLDLLTRRIISRPGMVQKLVLLQVCHKSHISLSQDTRYRRESQSVMSVYYGISDD